MPTYDYQCRACRHRFEHFQSIKDHPIRKCPKCKKLRLERLIGAGGGVIFKGTGFYTTDYRSPSYETAKKSDSATPPPTEPAKSSEPVKKDAAPAKPKPKPKSKE